MIKINKVLYLKIIFFGSLVFFTLPISNSFAGITDGLRAYFPFDTTTEARCDMGTIDVRDPASHIYKLGKVGQGIHVGGTSEDPPAVYNSESVLNKDQGTIAFWFNPDWNGTDSPGDDPHRVFVGIYQGVAAGGSVELLYYHGTVSIVFGHFRNSPETESSGWLYKPVANVSSWTAGTWYHIAITWDSSKKKIYINGSLINTEATQAGFSMSAADVFVIGRHIVPKFRSTDGTFDEMAIWDRPLSLPEISSLCTTPSILNPSTTDLPTKSSLPPITPSSPVAVSAPILITTSSSIDLDTATGAYLFKIGEPVLLKVRVSNNSEQKRDLKILFELFDYNNKVVWKRSIQTSVSAGAEYTSTPKWIADRAGSFRVQFSAWDNTGEILLSKELIVGVINSDERIDSPEDCFIGTHLPWDARVFEKAIKRSSDMGIYWTRVHDVALWTWWTTVQPEKDKWVWHDDAIDSVIAQGISIIGLLESTPRWASSAPEKAKDFYAYRNYPPKDMKDFEKYVYETVKHYKDKINVWEVWNEPHGTGFWMGTPEEYVELASIAYRAAKSANPSCKVIVGGGLPISEYPFTEKALSAGLTKYGDYFSIHAYYNQNEPEGVLFVEKGLEWIRKKMKESGRVIPIWDTEMNAWYPTGFKSSYSHPAFSEMASGDVPTAKESAAGISRTIGLELGLGIERTFYYFESGGAMAFPLYGFDQSDYKGAPTIFAIVLSVAGRFVNGAKSRGKADWPPSLRAYIYDKGKGSTGCLWGMIQSDDTVVLTVVVDGSLKVYDIMGNRVGVKRKDNEMRFQIGWEPVWIESDTISAENLKGILDKASFSGLEIAEERHKYRTELTKSAKEEKLMEQSQDFEYALNIPKERWMHIDLRQAANMAFHDDTAGDGIGGWADEGPTNDMTGMLTGNQVFCGVPFEIINPDTNKNKSVITLFGGQGQFFPKKSNPIPVNTALEKLYFLHACTWGQKGNYVADYYIYYNDSSSEKIDIKAPDKVGDWFWLPSEDEGCHVVAIDRLGSEGQKVGTAYLRILEWVNPHPGKVIDHISIVSAESISVPIVIAISGVK